MFDLEIRVFAIIFFSHCPVSAVLDCSNYINTSSIIYEQKIQLLNCFNSSPYSTVVIPGNNPSGSKNFKLYYDFNLISYLAGDNGEVLVSFDLFVGWFDERKAWKSNSDELIEIGIPSNQVWCPNYYIPGCISDECRLKLDEDDYVIINKSGFVSFQIVRKFDIVCDMVLDDFPFDFQVCSLHFIMQKGSVCGLNLSIENFNYFSTESENDNIVFANGEWRNPIINKQQGLKSIVHNKILSSFIRGSNVDASRDIGFTITIRLERYFWNYLYVIVIPCVIFSLLPMFVMCVPKESGEKLSFAIVVLLTFEAFEALVLTIVQNATTLPWFMFFIFLGSIFSFLFVIYGIGVMLGYDLDILFTSQKCLAPLVKGLLWCDERICFIKLPESCLRPREVDLLSSGSNDSKRNRKFFSGKISQVEPDPITTPPESTKNNLILRNPENNHEGKIELFNP